MENNPDEGLVANPSTSSEPTGEAVPSCLDIHSCLPTQVAILGRRYYKVDPINSIDNTNSIEFKVSSAENELIYPRHTILQVQARVLKANGNEIPSRVNDNAGNPQHNPGSQVCPANGLSYMLFKNLTVKLNDTQISHGDGMYAYRGDLDTQLLNNVQAKKGSLRMIGYFHEDRSFDELVEIDDAIHWENPAAATKDTGFHRRLRMSKASQRFYFDGKIHSEIFDQPKVLPPSSTLYLEFTRQPQDFCYVTNRDDHFQLQIEKINLLVEKVKVDPEIITGMLTAMSAGKNAVLPIRRVQMQYATRMRSNDFSKPNLFNEGECLPRRLFIAFVDSAAFKGHRKRDPFNYKTIEIESFCLRIGGDTIPYPSQTCGHNENDVINPLRGLLQATGSYLETHDLGIDPDKFLHGSYILGWDLSNSEMPPGVNYELPLVKSCDLEMQLSADPQVYYTMIVYAEYDSEIEIDFHRGVKKKNFGTAE